MGEATALRDAVTMMYERGETDVSTATLRRALQVLDGKPAGGPALADASARTDAVMLVRQARQPDYGSPPTRAS